MVRRIICVLVLLLWLPSLQAGAVPMANDPNGFEGITWGANLADSDSFVKVEDAGRLRNFELKAGVPTLGNSNVDSMRFMTIDGQFARVTVRYHGKEVHDQVLGYLQNQYGPLDRTPGQIAGGVVKVQRQTELGYDECEAPLPALVSVTAGVVEPRYPSFKGIMAAKSKPVDTVTATDLGVTAVGWAGANQQIVDVADAPARAAGEIIEDDGESFTKIVAFLENLKVI